MELLPTNVDNERTEEEGSNPETGALTDGGDLSEVLDQARYEGQPETHREAISQALCRRLGLRSLVIRKHLGNPPMFHMSANGQEGTIGRIHNVTSQKTFRDRVAECTGLLPPNQPHREWEDCAQAILDIAEDVDLGDASHPTRQTIENLRVYLSQYVIRPAEDLDIAAEHGEPFWYQGSPWVSTRDYGKWARRVVGDMLSHREICTSFHAIEMAPKAIHYCVHKGNRKWRTTGQFWRLSAKVVQELGLSEER